MGGGARAQISGGRPFQVQIDPQKSFWTTCYSAKGDLFRDFPFRHEISMRDEGIAPCILLLSFMPRLVAFDYLPAVQKGFGKNIGSTPRAFGSSPSFLSHANGRATLGRSYRSTEFPFRDFDSHTDGPTRLWKCRGRQAVRSPACELVANGPCAVPERNINASRRVKPTRLP